MGKAEARETLLTKLNDERLGGLPARTDDRSPEVIEPVETSRERDAGRRPEDIVEGRETASHPQRGSEQHGGISFDHQMAGKETGTSRRLACQNLP